MPGRFGNAAERQEEPSALPVARFYEELLAGIERERDQYERENSRRLWYAVSSSTTSSGRPFTVNTVGCPLALSSPRDRTRLVLGRVYCNPQWLDSILWT